MKPCGHEPPEAGCRLCELAAGDERYRRLWGTAGKPRLSVDELARRRRH